MRPMRAGLLLAGLSLVMLLVGFGAALALDSTHEDTTTFTTTVTPENGPGFLLNCVVTFHGDDPYDTTTVSGNTTETVLVNSTYTSLLKDYTTTTAESSEPGEAVSTTTALTSAQGFPIWNETVCTWLPT
jgi:hypothetical protein